MAPSNFKEKTEISILNAKLLDFFIQDILDLSQIRRGTLKLDPSPIDLERLIEEVFQISYIEAKNKNIQLISSMYNQKKIVRGVDSEEKFILQEQSYVELDIRSVSPQREPHLKQQYPFQQN